MSGPLHGVRDPRPHPRARRSVLHDAPRRSRRGRRQGRVAGRGPHASGVALACRRAVRRVLPERQPEQAEHRDRSQGGRGTRDLPPAGSVRRRRRRELPCRGDGFARALVRGAERVRAVARLRIGARASATLAAAKAPTRIGRRSTSPRKRSAGSWGSPDRWTGRRSKPGRASATSSRERCARSGSSRRSSMRSATGEGQYVDVAMYDGVLAMSERMVPQYSYTGEVPRPQGNTHPQFCPFGIFPADDGYVTIAAPTNNHWRALCDIIERPELGLDDRYKNVVVRLEHQRRGHRAPQRLVADETEGRDRRGVGREGPGRAGERRGGHLRGPTRQGSRACSRRSSSRGSTGRSRSSTARSSSRRRRAACGTAHRCSASTPTRS